MPQYCDGIIKGGNLRSVGTPPDEAGQGKHVTVDVAGLDESQETGRYYLPQ